MSDIALTLNHLNHARNCYNQAKRFVKDANSGRMSKSVAFAYLNHARANLKTAMRNAEIVLGRK